MPAVDAGATIFAVIDRAAAAASAGLVLRPTTLLVLGNPKAGTPLVQAEPLAALDLPLKIAVWEEPDGVRVGFTAATEPAVRHPRFLDVVTGVAIAAP